MYTGTVYTKRLVTCILVPYTPKGKWLVYCYRIHQKVTCILVPCTPKGKWHVYLYHIYQKVSDMYTGTVYTRRWLYWYRIYQKVLHYTATVYTNRYVTCILSFTCIHVTFWCIWHQYTCHLPFGVYGTSIHVTYLLVYTVPVYMSLTFWCIW